MTTQLSIIQAAVQDFEDRLRKDFGSGVTSHLRYKVENGKLSIKIKLETTLSEAGQ